RAPLVFLSRLPRPPLSTLFPYTTLFRSALVAELCAEAIGPGRVLAVAMPDGKGGKDLRDARKWAKALGIEFRVVGIGPVVTALEKRLNAYAADSIARGNLRARARMAVLYYI